MAKYYEPKEIKVAGEDESKALNVEDMVIPEGEISYIPSGEIVAVDDLVINTGATLVAEGDVDVFGSTTEDGTITGNGTISQRSV